MISNSYASPNLAGLLRTLTPKSDTTDIVLYADLLISEILSGYYQFCHSVCTECLRVDSQTDRAPCGTRKSRVSANSHWS